MLTSWSASCIARQRACAARLGGSRSRKDLDRNTSHDADTRVNRNRTQRLIPTSHDTSQVSLTGKPEDGVVPRARALLVGLEGMTGDIVGRLLQAEPDCEVVKGTFRRDE